MTFLETFQALLYFLMIFHSLFKNLESRSDNVESTIPFSELSDISTFTQSWLKRQTLD